MTETTREKTPEIIPSSTEPETSLERITRGEVDMQVATAKRYPRSLQKFKQDALAMATLDQDTAESCFYVLPRGGKNIEGPGVRLAEIVASCWGNIRAETRVIDEGDKFVTSQGTCWDLERNVLVRTEVQRRITDKNGRRYNDDMITTTANAASAIAFRNAIFKVVPSAYTKAIYEEARKVAVGTERTLSDRREKAVSWFAKAGVVKERVLAVLNKKGIEDIDLTDMATLQGLRTAIQEGTTSIDEAFPPEQLKEGTHGFGFKKAAEESKDKPPPAAAEKVDPKTGEITQTKAAEKPAQESAASKEAGF